MTDRLPGTGDIHLDLVIGNFSAEILHRAAAIRDIASSSDSGRFLRLALRRSWSLTGSSPASSCFFSGKAPVSWFCHPRHRLSFAARRRLLYEWLPSSASRPPKVPLWLWHLLNCIFL